MPVLLLVALALQVRAPALADRAQRADERSTADSARDIGKARGAFTEDLLFTHRGLSGPAILQVSSYWRNGDPVAIDFLPDAASGWLRGTARMPPRTVSAMKAAV